MNIYFRNLSDETVRLTCKLTDRKYFDKLPNRVTFYDIAAKRNDMYGERRYKKLITWTDSTNFYIDIPAHTIIDVADISNGAGLGKEPNVFLTATTNTKSDTILLDDYHYLGLAEGFQLKKAFFSRWTYYYDFR